MVKRGSVVSDRFEYAAQIPLAVGGRFLDQRDLAVTPDGRTIITTSWNDPPHVAFTDAASRTLTGRLELPELIPTLVAAAPDNRRAYVAALVGSDLYSVEGATGLEIDLESHSTQNRIELPDVPTAGLANAPDIAVSPDGGQVVFVISHATHGVPRSRLRSPLPDRPTGWPSTPAGKDSTLSLRSLENASTPTPPGSSRRERPRRQL